mgnify:FL=1
MRSQISDHLRFPRYGDGSIGRGEKLEAILADSVSVVEGFPTARSAWNLARTRDVSTPIIDEVYAMLHEGKDLRQALHDLTTRSSKAED